MRPGEKATLEHKLRELAAGVVEAAERLKRSGDGPPFRFGVGWGNAPRAIISIDDREVHRHHVEEMVDDAIWALFESCRDGGDPGDPAAFARVMDRIVAEAQKRCHQRIGVTAPATGIEAHVCEHGRRWRQGCNACADADRLANRAGLMMSEDAARELRGAAAKGGSDG